MQKQEIDLSTLVIDQIASVIDQLVSVLDQLASVQCILDGCSME